MPNRQPKLSAIVIDDEEFARDELSDLLHETECVEVIAQASNAITGLKAIAQHKADVVFLDIQMPQISGLEMLSMLDQDQMPHIVFVTAFDQYALQAFEDNAFDYLLKPIEPQRLKKTIKRLKKQITPFDPQRDPNHQQILNLAPEQLAQVPCMGHNRILIIPIQEIESAFSDL
ncbi:MAG: response regulator, partial [Vibrio sp.]